MRQFRLYLITLFLLTVVNIVNRKIVKRRTGTLEGYDRSEAFSLDVFACRNYRSFWNAYLTDGSENAYKFGADMEPVSSALGENILRKTQSKKGRKGILASWFTGNNLSNILDFFFNEKDHCINARKAYLEKLKKDGKLLEIHQ